MSDEKICKDLFRPDLWFKAQQKIVENFGTYMVGASDLVKKGACSPSDWLKLYADMWSNIAKDLGAVADKL